jgi:hypothetical protein
MGAVALSVFRLACRIAGQSAGIPSRTNEASCVALCDKIGRSDGKGIFTALAHNRRPWTRVLLSAIACTCLVLTGCGGGHSSSSTTPPSSAQGTIGATGGVVSIPQGAQVVMPQNALATDTTVGVDQSATGAPPLPAGAKLLGPIVAFTPHGTSFAVPVTMTLPFDGASLPSGTKPALAKTNDSQTGGR